MLYAIGHHDRGWIDLDETPFWNDDLQGSVSLGEALGLSWGLREYSVKRN
ncbi:hypothetical protein J2Z22_004550 [Paenibacillus forsythiae]|uniref:Uncharacterized protein n=1 Tax=Paenibacillus forsythiae TaxID=365616 RepID=A0ABU3HDQ3_9BACL|nr:hypothetical protein [Paenibacillus forsythiae]